MSRTTPKLSGIGRLRVAGEETYLTEQSGLYTYLKTLGFDRSGLTVAPLMDDYQKVDFHADKVIPGPSIGSVSFQVNPFSWSSSKPSSAPAHVDPSDTGGSPTAFDMFAGMLASVVGNMTVGGYTEDEAESGGGQASTTSLIAATTLTSFENGQAFAFYDTNGDLQVGWFKAITDATPDTGTVLQTLAGTPIQSGDDANTLWGSWTIFSKRGQPYVYGGSDSAAGSTPPQGWSLDFAGHDADDELVMTGCMPTSISFNFNRGELGTMDMTMGVGLFEEAGSGGTPTVGTWSLPLSQAVTSAKCVWGTTAATNLRIGSLTIDLNLDVQPMPDVNKAGGIGGWYVAGMDPTISFSVYRDISEEVTDYAQQNGKPFTFWYGDQPGSIVAFCVPNAYVQEFPSPGEENGAVISNVVLKPGPYTGDGGNATEDTPADSPFRIAFL